MLGFIGSHDPSSGLENVVATVLSKLNVAPVTMLLALVEVFAISALTPLTFTKRNLPFVNPAFSTSVPVDCFVPIYTATELFIAVDAVPPSLLPITIVLSCSYGHANAFSHAPTPLNPDKLPFVDELNLPKMYPLPLLTPVATVAN